MTNHNPNAMGPAGFSGLTAREIVAQSQAIHPDWDERMHAWFLSEEEGINLEQLPAAPGERSPHDTIGRWLTIPLPSRRSLA